MGRGRRPFRSLSTRAEFDRVFKDGKRRRLGPLVLVVRACPGAFAVGFKIGRKVGKAVVRNLVRRRLRSILDRLELTDPTTSGVELVFLVRPGADRVRFQRLEAKVVDALRGFGLRPRPEATAREAPAATADAGVAGS